MPSLLIVKDLTMRFGGLTAVDKVSFEVQDKSITALIGPNGAGKTTVFNCITGFYKPTEGSIHLQHDSDSIALERMGSERICKSAKVVRTFQNIRLFKGMSLLENLMVAQHNELIRASKWSIAGLLGFRSFLQAERAAVDKAMRWLECIGLAQLADTPAGDLPYGDQRRVEIARAMCTGPRLLCLDEPAAGLNSVESAQLTKLIREIRDEHQTSVLLIEHDMSVVMQISEQIVVLEYGRKIAEGIPSEIRNDPSVIRAYLGVDENEATSA